MTRCPNCGKLANPLKLLTYSRWTQYQCTKCGTKSSLKMKGLILIYILGISILLGIDKVVGILPALLIAMVVSVLAEWIFLKLYPLENNSDKEKKYILSK